MMEQVVSVISQLAKQSDDAEQQSQFLEHCSELCFLISQSFEDFQNLVELLQRLNHVIELEIQQQIALHNPTSTNQFDIQNNREVAATDLPRQIEQTREIESGSTRLLQSTGQEETEESDQFVSDFSDDDFDEEQELERKAVRFVEEF